MVDRIRIWSDVVLCWRILNLWFHLLVFHQRYHVVSLWNIRSVPIHWKSRSTIIKIAPHSGIVLHYNLLKSIIGSVNMRRSVCRNWQAARAPLSFYSKSEIGTLLNRWWPLVPISSKVAAHCHGRFSQDIQLVDKKLPPALSSLTTRKFNSNSCQRCC